MEPPVVRRFLPDSVTGAGREERGTLADWVERFAFVWEAPAARLEALLDLLSPDVRLVAPGYAPTVGRDAARRAFERTLLAFPDLTATVKSWGTGFADEARHTDGFTGTLYVEMRFAACVGRRRLTWPNVDRFTFVRGEAVERVAHFDPTRVRAALLRSPSGLLRYLRLRARLRRS